MYPLLLKIGSFAIGSHDFFLSMGFLAGTLILLREIKKDIEDPAKLLDLAIYIIIVSIIGARLFHVIVEAPEFYLKNPLNIFKVWNGGWTFYGGLLASIIFALFYVRRKKMDFYRTIDIFTPSVALGLFFGRVACFMAGCCYGKICPVDFPFGIKFKIINFVKPQADPLDTLLYPTQVIEALAAAILFIVITLYRPKKRFHGELAAIFLVAYSTIRFLLEYLRADDIRGVWFGGAISTSQIISIPLFAAGIWLFLSRSNPKNQS